MSTPAIHFIQSGTPITARSAVSGRNLQGNRLTVTSGPGTGLPAGWSLIESRGVSSGEAPAQGVFYRSATGGAGGGGGDVGSGGYIDEYGEYRQISANGGFQITPIGWALLGFALTMLLSKGKK